MKRFKPSAYILGHPKVSLILALGLIIILSMGLALYILPRQKTSGSKSQAELTSKRTATSQTFFNSSTGKYTSKFYAQPVNYKDSSGDWQKIDTDWQKKGNDFVITRASYNATIPVKANDWASFEVNGHKVGFKLGDTPGEAKDVLVKDNVYAEVTGSKATYKNVYPNTDVERIATPTGLKQNFVLKAKGHPTSFSETIRTDLNLKLEKGVLNYYKGPKLYITSEAPTVTDSTGTLFSAKYEIKGNVLVTRIANLSGAKYPVTADPSFTNTHYLNGSGLLFKFGSTWPPTTTYTSTSLLYVGAWLQSGPGYGIYRNYTSYGTNSIPDTATITSANFIFYPYWGTSTKTPDFDLKIGYGTNTSYNPTWGPTLTTADWGSGTNVSTLTTTSSTWAGTAVTKPVTLASVNKLGNTEYEISSSLETGAAPTNFRTLWIDYMGSSPRLEVTYSTGINAPTINSLEPTPTQQKVNFSDNSNEEDDFHFYVSTSPGATSESGDRYLSDSTEKTGTGFRNKTLVTTNTSSGRFLPNTRYYIRSRAHSHGAGTYSPYSNELSKVTYANAPENLTVNNGWDAVNGYKNTLSWRDSEPDYPTPKYHVYYYTAGSSSWTQIGGETVTGTSFIHTGLVPGKTYYYRVFSVNGAGEENPDYAKTSILSSGGVINAVSDADWSASEGYHVHLGWQDNDIFNPSPKYRVYVSINPLDGSGWSTFSQIGGDIIVPYYKHLGANPNSMYAYKIYAVNAANQESAEYAYTELKVNATAGGIIPNAAPTLSSISADSITQLTINIIDQSSNEDDFHFYLGSGAAPTVDSGQVNSVSTNATGRNYSKFFSGLSPNSRYYIRAKAHDHNNNIFSNYSNELSKYTLANIPQALKGQKIADNQFQLNWDAGGNPAGTTYELYYGNTNTIIYTGTNTTYTHTTSNRINTYKVRAKNGDGVATDWTEWIEVSTVSPHANYTQDPEQCAVCHSSHTATIDELLRGPQNMVYQADFCYGCHDGTGSIYNVKAAVDGNPSHHPVKDAANPTGVLNCTSCHDPHGVKKPDGSYYAKLLKSQDSNGNKIYEGNEFCGACHGLGSTLIGGDHLSIFNNISHNTKTANPPSGTKIKCLNCHGNNNSSGSEGTAPHGSDYSRITKLNEENLCFQCHDNPANSENGFNIKELFSYPLSSFQEISGQPINYTWYSARHNVTDAEQVDADATTAGNQPSKVECKNCHNPHKNDRGEKKIANPENVFNLFDSKRPDPKLWDYQDNKGFAVFMPFYRQRAQDLGSSSDDSSLWSYQGPQTSADGQDTTINSATPTTSQDTTATSPGWPDGTQLGTTSINLKVGKQSGGNLRSLIRFVDLYKIPPGSIVNKAYLTWPQNPDTAAPLDNTKPPISIYRVTTPWAESVTWNQRPLFDSTPAISSSRGTIISTLNTGLSYDNGMKYLAWDITTLVQGWINLSYGNLGLMLMSPEAEAQANDYFVSFSSSEQPVYTSLGSKLEAKPALIIQYSTQNPPMALNMNSFCLSCHDGSPPPGVLMPNISRQRDMLTQTDTLNVSAFAKTDSTGDVHGGQASILKKDSSGIWRGTTVGSYRYGMAAIQCTDCHQPHGEKNVYHFQKNINWIAEQNINSIFYNNNLSDGPPYSTNWNRLCQSCHLSTHVLRDSCTKCHYHGAKADGESTSNF